MVERIALITALILDRPMCLDCLVVRAEVSLDEVVAILELIQSALAVHWAIGQCWACRRDGRTVSVNQPRV